MRRAVRVPRGRDVPLLHSSCSWDVAQQRRLMQELASGLYGRNVNQVKGQSSVIHRPVEDVWSTGVGMEPKDNRKPTEDLRLEESGAGLTPGLPGGTPHFQQGSARTFGTLGTFVRSQPVHRQCSQMLKEETSASCSCSIIESFASFGSFHVLALPSQTSSVASDLWYLQRSFRLRDQAGMCGPRSLGG